MARNHDLSHAMFRLAVLRVDEAVLRWLSIGALAGALLQAVSSGLRWAGASRIVRAVSGEPGTATFRRFWILLAAIATGLPFGRALDRYVFLPPHELFEVDWKWMLGRSVRDLGIVAFFWALGLLLVRFPWGRLAEALRRMARAVSPRLAVASLLAAVTLHAGTVLERSLRPPAGPNVLLIVVDTLRADHLGIDGHVRDTSPNLDRLARSSIVFRNALSTAPWTTPAVGAMFTGRYPTELGIANWPVVLGESRPLLAEVLRQHSYRTGAIVSHSLVGGALGFAQGFEGYDEDDARWHRYVSSESISDKAIRFLRRHHGERFFLFLHYFDPHSDFIEHEAYRFDPDYRGPVRSAMPIDELRALAPGFREEDIRHLKAIYDSEIRFTDEHIGRVIRELESRGLYENTLILFTADHGEAFAERETRWIGHARTVFQEVVRVPLFIKPAGPIVPRTVDRFVSTIDVGSTLIRALGLKVPDAFPLGASLLDDETPARPIFTETKRGAELQSVALDGWKLIHDLRGGTASLFDLGSDPAEMADLAASRPDRVKELEAVRALWNETVLARGGDGNAEEFSFSEGELERLKALGYVR